MKSSWGDERQDGIDFFMQPFGSGLILDAISFRQQLMRAVQEQSIPVQRTTQLMNCDYVNGVWQLSLLVEGKTILVNGNCVIDCAGKEMLFADHWGLKRIEYDRLTAYMTILPAADGVGEEVVKAQVEATENGWWLATEMWDGQMLCVFASDSDIVQDLGDDLNEVWLGQLKQTQYIKHHVRVESPFHINIRSSVSSHCNRFHGDHWLVAGESAHSFDFLSGQGIDIALDSGIAAAAAVDDLMQGNSGAFDGYAAARKTLFESYLRTRAEYYSSVGKYRDSLFWSRRRMVDVDSLPIWLDPTQEVCYRESRKDLFAEALAESLMPLSEFHRLIEMCKESRPAHEVLSLFLNSTADGQCEAVGVDDHRSILAMQTFA